MIDPAQAVDAAVARLRNAAQHIRHLPLDEFPDSRQELADWIDAGCTALAEARQQLAAQAQEIHKLTGQNELRKKQIARFPFCSDHRDKVHGLPCRECEREKAERRAEYATAAQRQLAAQDGLQLILADMEIASTGVDEACGTAEYQARLVALGLIARHFLRERAAIRAARAPQEPT